MNDSKCLACNQEIQLFCQKKGYKIFRCSGCGLGYTWNLKSQKVNYHRDQSYIKEEKLFSNIFLRRVKLIDSLKSEPGIIIEVGSSAGTLLKLLKGRGWKVFGVEPSKEAAEFAQNQGIETVRDKFETAKLAVESADVIIINHTLEHLPDPSKVLDKAFKILKDDGILIIDLPNFDSLSAKLLKCRWPYLLPSEHRWHFTLKSLSKLLDQYHFQVIFSHTYSGIWDYGDPGLELRQSFTGLKKRFINNLLTSAPALIATKLNKGTDLTVAAKKVNI